MEEAATGAIRSSRGESGETPVTAGPSGGRELREPSSSRYRACSVGRGSPGSVRGRSRIRTRRGRGPKGGPHPVDPGQGKGDRNGGAGLGTATGLGAGRGADLAGMTAGFREGTGGGGWSVPLSMIVPVLLVAFLAVGTRDPVLVLVVGEPRKGIHGRGAVITIGLRTSKRLSGRGCDQQGDGMAGGCLTRVRW